METCYRLNFVISIFHFPVLYLSRSFLKIELSGINSMSIIPWVWIFRRNLPALNFHRSRIKTNHSNEQSTIKAKRWSFCSVFQSPRDIRGRIFKSRSQKYHWKCSASFMQLTQCSTLRCIFFNVKHFGVPLLFLFQYLWKTY